MSANRGNVVVYVTYQGTPESRFDRHYYVNEHLPLALQAWHPYGLESIAAFFPAVAQAGTIAICECTFRDETAVTAAFGSPETQAVMADVSRFTDTAPSRSRAVSL